jgi:hypothetical protein
MFVTLTLGLLLLAAPSSEAVAQDAYTLSVEVNPRVCFSPCEFRAEVRVERHPDNRELVIRADSLQYYSSTTKYLDGETDAVLHEQFFRNVPAGTYLVQAMLTRENGAEFVEEVEVLVDGPDSSY